MPNFTLGQYRVEKGEDNVPTQYEASGEDLLDSTH